MRGAVLCYPLIGKTICRFVAQYVRYASEILYKGNIIRRYLINIIIEPI